MPISLTISLIPTPKNSCLDVIFVLTNNVTSIMLAELCIFQYGTCSFVLNIKAKLKLEEFGSKKTVAIADHAPLNTFLILRKLIQEEKVLNFLLLSLSNT